MIKTERLTIRRVCMDDWKAMQTIWEDVSKTEYAKYDIPHETDDDGVKERISRWASYRESTEHIFFAVCLNHSVIGYVALNKMKDAHDIGYCFHTRYHKMGYAKESISKILEVVKELGVKRLTAGTALDNIPSVKLLHSLGFRQIGTEKVSFYKDGKGNDIFFDGGVFALVLGDE